MKHWASYLILQLVIQSSTFIHKSVGLCWVISLVSRPSLWAFRPHVIGFINCCTNINKGLCPHLSLQAVKKGASQTDVGLIFGCYAICNLINSLIMGRYVSRSHYSS